MDKNSFTNNLYIVIITAWNKDVQYTKVDIMKGGINDNLKRIKDVNLERIAKEEKEKTKGGK